MSSSSPLVFLAGPLRSGSTLLTLMLDRHPRVIAPGEFDFLFDALGKDGGMRAAQSLPAAELDHALSVHRGYLAARERYDADGSSLERTRGFVAKYHQEGVCRLLCLHRNFLSAHELFPEARFIHLLRDPRDCAKSAVAIGFAGNLHYGADPWLDSETSWERLRPKLAGDQFIEVRYEELVTDPVRELGRICTFLGLDYQPRMLDLSGTTYDTPSARFASQWRRGMSPVDVEVVEQRVGSLMRERGYEPVGARIKLPMSRRPAALWLQNMLSRHQRRIRLFGCSLWLQEMLSRRLGLRSWSRAVNLKMHPIINRTLK
jgi:hypothetical protein